MLFNSTENWKHTGQTKWYLHMFAFAFLCPLCVVSCAYFWCCCSWEEESVPMLPVSTRLAAQVLVWDIPESAAPGSLPTTPLCSWQTSLSLQMFNQREKRKGKGQRAMLTKQWIEAGIGGWGSGLKSRCQSMSFTTGPTNPIHTQGFNNIHTLTCTDHLSAQASLLTSNNQ